MRKPAIIAFGVTALAGIILVWFQTRPAGEPSFKGRALSSWFAELSGRRSVWKQSRAEKAIGEIGTNAIPYLLRMLSLRESALRREWRELTDKRLKAGGNFERGIVQSMVNRVDPLDEYHRRATIGFRALGPRATNAIPQIIGLINDEQTADRALLALAMIGPHALAALNEACAHTNKSVSWNAKRALHQLWEDYPETSPYRPRPPQQQTGTEQPEPER